MDELVNNTEKLRSWDAIKGKANEILNTWPSLSETNDELNLNN